MTRGLPGTALNQIEVATTVTTPILVAILAMVAGVVIVGAGGGLVKPMQSRWESYLTRAEQEAPKVRQEAANAPSVKDQAKAAKAKAQAAYDQTEDTTVVGRPTTYGSPRP